MAVNNDDEISNQLFAFMAKSSDDDKPKDLYTFPLLLFPFETLY